MPELGTYGSVRGALSNERPYRDRSLTLALLTLRRVFKLRRKQKSGRYFVPASCLSVNV